MNSSQVSLLQNLIQSSKFSILLKSSFFISSIGMKLYRINVFKSSKFINLEFKSSLFTSKSSQIKYIHWYWIQVKLLYFRTKPWCLIKVTLFRLKNHQIFNSSQVYLFLQAMPLPKSSNFFILDSSKYLDLQIKSSSLKPSKFLDVKFKSSFLAWKKAVK